MLSPLESRGLICLLLKVTKFSQITRAMSFRRACSITGKSLRELLPGTSLGIDLFMQLSIFPLKHGLKYQSKE